VLAGANRNGVTQLIPAADAVPPVRGKPGRPRRRPKELHGDRGFDSDGHRMELRKRHVRPMIARRNTARGSGLGKVRWVVERTIGWFHQFRRLGARYDRDPARLEAFMALGCSIIALRFC
jgi:transposase